MLLLCTGDLTIGKLPESHGEMRENPVLLEGFWIRGERPPKYMGLVSSFVTHMLTGIICNKARKTQILFCEQRNIHNSL